MKYTCCYCGYIYTEAAGDPEQGVCRNTRWEDVPNLFVCPVCGSKKERFSEEF